MKYRHLKSVIFFIVVYGFVNLFVVLWTGTPIYAALDFKDISSFWFLFGAMSVSMFGFLAFKGLEEARNYLYHYRARRRNLKIE